MVTISQAFAIAVQHHQAGRLEIAEQLYRQILEAEPEHVDAMHLLGLIAHQLGMHEAGAAQLERAIALKGDVADLHFSLGGIYHALQRIPQAIACYRRALELKPEHADACNNLGNALKGQGRLDDAVTCYRRALELRPSFVEALNNLGVTLRDQGKSEAAEACCRRALELKPDFAEAHNNLGIALKDQGQVAEAAACYRRALALKPDYAEALNNLGVASYDLGQMGDAVACCRRAVELRPNYAEAHNNLGNALKDLGRVDEAMASYRRAVELKPDYVAPLNNLGIVLKESGRLDDAVACYRQAMERKPDCAEVYNNLGVALQAQGKPDDAAACYRRAMELRPDDATAHYNLANALKDLNQLDDAVVCYQRTLELNPDCAEAYNNLGLVLKDQGRLDDALACYRRALARNPGDLLAHNNMTYTRLFCADDDPATRYAELRRWNQQYAEPLGSALPPPDNDRNPQRRLRIGYVSPDFRSHPVGQFLVPLLESHNHEAFEIYGYASVQKPDPMTDRCRACCDVWRDVQSLSDFRLAETIRQDRIDILVDLTLHMAGSRLLVFARRPAPVQITYLGYCGTTGLEAIDYRLTDPYLDPVGQEEPFYAEQSIHLPETYWCYRPSDLAPPVALQPACASGVATFGCLNNFCKQSAPAFATWCALLKAVPQSRLLLHAQAGSHRDRLLAVAAERGLSPDRVEFVPFQPPHEYLRTYQRIDVALDPFPYSGGTTTCDALWMGVPVVTLAGQTAVGRGGVSILSNVGLQECVACDTEQYVRIAAGLARSVSRLAELRATLRQRMQGSPLMNAPRFAGHVEAAYREMWRRWCAK
jgi:protein O-GlcNAc transferase